MVLILAFLWGCHAVHCLRLGLSALCFHAFRGSWECVPRLVYSLTGIAFAAILGFRLQRPKHLKTAWHSVRLFKLRLSSCQWARPEPFLASASQNRKCELKHLVTIACGSDGNRSWVGKKCKFCGGCEMRCTHVLIASQLLVLSPRHPCPIGV